MDRVLVDERGLSWLALVLALAGAGTALADTDGNVTLHFVAALVPFVVLVAVPRFPAWAALIATTSVVVYTNFDLRAEGMFFFPVIAVVLVTATDRNRLRAYAFVVLAMFAPLGTWLVGHEETRGWNWPFWSMGILLTAVMGSVLFRQRELNEQLDTARRQLAEQAVADERRRIAREIHDLVGHSLSVVLLHVTGARHQIRRDVDEAEHALGEAERVGRESLAEIRHTVGLLRDADGFGTRPMPGIDDIYDLVDEYRQGGLALEAAIDGGFSAVDGVTGLTVYRVVQESLTNVAKHAPDARAMVNIAIGETETVVAVTNTLPAHTVSAPMTGGLGIVGMHERARAIGGELEAGPSPTGWTVNARVPHARVSAPSTLEPPT